MRGYFEEGFRVQRNAGCILRYTSTLSCEKGNISLLINKVIYRFIYLLIHVFIYPFIKLSSCLNINFSLLFF